MHANGAKFFLLFLFFFLNLFLFTFFFSSCSVCVNFCLCGNLYKFIKSIIPINLIQWWQITRSYWNILADMLQLLCNKQYQPLPHILLHIRNPTTRTTSSSEYNIVSFYWRSRTPTCRETWHKNHPSEHTTWDYWFYPGERIARTSSFPSGQLNPQGRGYYMQFDKSLCVADCTGCMWIFSP